MAYDQSQQTNFEFDLTNTNDTTYEGQPLAYQQNLAHNQQSISTLPDAQMMSHGEGRSQYRKDSFANSTGVLSPVSSLPGGWDGKYPSHGDDHVAAMAGHGFRFDNNPFIRHDSNVYFNTGSYLMEHSDSSTSTMYEGMAAKYEQSPFTNGGNEHLQSQSQSQPSPQGFTPIQREPNFKVAPQVQAPMSPHSQEEWKTFTDLEKQGRAFPSHIRITSPPKHVDRRRGDGVRKKNAKIEIPDGRNVQVIEELMATEHDESLLKELKGQKRLLRNREAALASRQRKKKHTEDLEGKVNELNNVIAALESRLHECATHLETETRQRHFYEHRLQEADLTIAGLRQEKEHMVVQHTQATSSLRQRISILEDPVASPAPAMSMAPSSTGYTDINSDLDHFNINAPDWEKHIRMFNPENDWEHFNAEHAPEATVQPSKLQSPPMRLEGAKKNEAENVPTSVLLMLLLCGAWVASNSASSTVPVIPRMPDEVVAVSNSVLNNLLYDVNTEVAPTLPTRYSMDFTDAPAQNWPSQMSDTSTLANMHRHLTSPSRRQLAEQASMLTPDQYNSLTNPTYSGQNVALPVRPVAKRNIAEILSNMRQESIAKGSTSDVYTRSLLWEQVPDDVVRQFKQAVRDSETVASEPSGTTTAQEYNNNHDFKQLRS